MTNMPHNFNISFFSALTRESGCPGGHGVRVTRALYALVPRFRGDERGGFYG